MFLRDYSPFYETILVLMIHTLLLELAMRAFSLISLSLLLLVSLLPFSFDAEARFCGASPFARSGSGYDRYTYRYRKACYYPYYNSGYWKSASILRMRPRPYYKIPRYYPAWGYPKY